MTLTLKVANQLFFKVALAHDDAPPHQVWLQKVRRFRRHCPLKIQTDGQTGPNIPGNADEKKKKKKEYRK